MNESTPPVSDDPMIFSTEDSNRKHDITFSTKQFPSILVLKDNGDIFVKGKMVENDKEVVQALREFLEEMRRMGNVR
jgi:hypothetical protein